MSTNQSAGGSEHGERRHGQRRTGPAARSGPGHAFDPQTGLPTRAVLEGLIEAGRLRQDRRRSMACVVIGIDDLDAVTMVHGIERSEQAVRSVADELRGLAGPSDMVFRGGVDRFVMLRAGGELAETWVWAQGLCERVRDTYVGPEGADVAVTVSVGAHELAPASLTLDTLDLAETAACVARERGGNRVCTWDSVVIDRACDHAATATAGLGGAGGGLGGAGGSGSTMAARAELLRRLESKLGTWQRAFCVEHAARVGELAVGIARRLGAPSGHFGRLREIGMLQAIGAATIPEALLGKNEALSHGEWAVVRTRAEAAGRIAQRLGADEATAECVRLCHARFDAPSDDGVELDGPQPWDAQLVSAAMVGAALIERRPQRASLARGAAASELLRQAGRRLAPDAARAACSVISEADDGPARHAA